MVETSPQDRRGPACILCGAKDHDRVGGMEFLLIGVADDAEARDDKEQYEEQSDSRQRPQKPISARELECGRELHPCAKNLEISWVGMAPSRITRQRSSPLLRSTMVEATSRGEVPPSTMMGMRSCS